MASINIDIALPLIIIPTCGFIALLICFLCLCVRYRNATNRYHRLAEEEDPSSSSIDRNNHSNNPATLENQKQEDHQKQLQGYCKDSYLFEIAEQNETDLLNLFLESAECNLNITNEEGDTPLLVAIAKKHFDVAKILIDDKRCDINWVNKKGESPLSLAACGNHVDIVARLMSRGKCNTWFALLRAIQERNKMALNVLRPHLDKLNTRDLSELIQEAVRSNFTDQLKLMQIEIKKYCNSKNNEDPLSLYIKRFGDCSKFSYNFWVMLDVFCSGDENHSWAPHVLAAAVERSTVEVCEYLIRKGANVNSAYPDGDSALFCALRLRCKDKVQLLLQNKELNLDSTLKGLHPVELAKVYGCDDHIIRILESKTTESIPQQIEIPPFESQSNDSFITLEELDTDLCQNHSPDAFQNSISAICSEIMNQKRHKIAKQLLILCGLVSNELSMHDKYKYFQFHAILSGSFREGMATKIELDVVCKFVNTVGLELSDTINVPFQSVWGKYCNHGHWGILSPKRVTQLFVEAFRFGLEQIQLKGHKVKGIYFNEHFVLVKDKISCLRLFWQEENDATAMEFFTDLAPAFWLSNTWLVAKSSLHDNDINATGVHFQPSYHEREREEILFLPKLYQEGLFIAKALRRSDIAASRSLKRFFIKTSINIEDFITSYMLKSCAMKIKAVDVKNGYHCAWVIYKVLQEDIMMGRVDSYFDRTTIVICNHNAGISVDSKAYTIVESCCLRRGIMSTIVGNILRWLNFQMVELEKKMFPSLPLPISCELQEQKPMEQVRIPVVDQSYKPPKYIRLRDGRDALFCTMTIVGYTGVGKTCLLFRYMNGRHRADIHSTIGVDFKIKIVDLCNNNLKAQIWDTSGQERYHNLARTYLKPSHGVLLVYDITAEDTFYKSAHHFLQEIEQTCNSSVQIMLIGNKIDLSSKRKISYYTGLNFAKELGVPFMEVSAKTGENVTEAFELLLSNTSRKYESKHNKNQGLH